MFTLLAFSLLGSCSTSNIEHRTSDEPEHEQRREKREA